MLGERSSVLITEVSTNKSRFSDLISGMQVDREQDKRPPRNERDQGRNDDDGDFGSRADTVRRSLGSARNRQFNRRTE